MSLVEGEAGWGSFGNRCNFKRGGASYFKTMNNETKAILEKRCEVQGTYGGKLNGTDFLKKLLYTRESAGSFN